MINDYMKMGFMAGLLFLVTVCSAHAQGESFKQYIETNTQPVGQVNVSGESASAAPAAAMSGKDRYEASCGFCHDTGTAGSPKLGSKAAWAPRLAQGMDTLVKHAVNGIGSMPAKGMCPSCSDDEIRSAVEYMVSKAK